MLYALSHPFMLLKHLQVKAGVGLLSCILASNPCMILPNVSIHHRVAPATATDRIAPAHGMSSALPTPATTGAGVGTEEVEATGAATTVNPVVCSSSAAPSALAVDFREVTKSPPLFLVSIVFKLLAPA